MCLVLFSSQDFYSFFKYLYKIKHFKQQLHYRTCRKKEYIAMLVLNPHLVLPSLTYLVFF
jgi:hypothetical protein